MVKPALQPAVFLSLKGWILPALLALVVGNCKGNHCVGFQITPAAKPEATTSSGIAGQDKQTWLYSTDFETDLNDWELSDAAAWKLDRAGSLPIIRQFSKASNYKPDFRSPFHQAILKDQIFDSFDLSVQVKSTHESYGHRDVCLFFGYQDANRFYYVHLGQTTDAHSNQIFLVNHADRKKISMSTNAGTPWDDQWHQVRLVRKADSGKIEVYFDGQSQPVMTAEDSTFVRGRIGIGSFDDTADWAGFRVRPVRSSRPETGEGSYP
jgi:hypothetical protein